MTSKEDYSKTEIKITPITADEFQSAIERGKQRKENQQKCEKLIGEILDVSNPKMRRKRLRNLKADIQGARHTNAVESSWSDYTIETIRDEIKKASKEIYKGSPSSEIGANDIWRKFWELDEKYKQNTAYDMIEDWLLSDLEYSREEVKEKFDITLKREAFTRSARNHRPHKL